MIAREVLIHAPAKEVYTALTTQQGISLWWSKNAIVGTKEGEEVKITITPDRIPIDMQFKIEELVENKKVRWGSTHNTNPAWLTTKITFAITEIETSSLIHFLHTDFPKKYDFTTEITMWVKSLQSLKDYCETGVGAPMQ